MGFKKFGTPEVTTPVEPDETPGPAPDSERTAEERPDPGEGVRFRPKKKDDDKPDDESPPAAIHERSRW